VAGEEKLSKDIDFPLVLKDLEINADRVGLVSSRSGHFDIIYTW